MRNLKILSLLVSALALTACGGEDKCKNVTCTASDKCHVAGTCNADTGTCSAETVKPCATAGQSCDLCDGACKGGAFTQPTSTVAVSFTVDDTANKAYTAVGQLQWKGSMVFDSTTRLLKLDSSWGGPPWTAASNTSTYPPLYDDGSFLFGGHEPSGACAGDNKWGITAFVTPPATGATTFEYGLINHQAGDGWIWPGSSNGSFVVTATSTAPITAPGATLKKYGTTDIKLVIDTNALTAPAGTSTWSYPPVRVKGSAWAWVEVTSTDDGLTGDDTSGDKKYTFVLSNAVGAGKQLSTLGLASSGDKPAFVFTLNGKEYRDATGATAGFPSIVGVKGYVKASGATTWTEVTVTNQTGGDHNATITIP